MNQFINSQLRVILFILFTILSSSIHASDTLSFSSPILLPAGQKPHALALADFNNDKLTDIAVLNLDSDNLDIFLNINGFSFNQIATYLCPDGPYDIDTGDFNLDGYVDLVTISSSVADPNLYIFLNDGTGHFSVDTSFTIPAYASRVETAFLDNNNTPDILVTYQFGTGINIYFTDSNANVVADTLISSGTNSIETICRDYDNDGDIDIAVSVESEGKVKTYLNDGDGNFNLGSANIVLSDPWSLTSGEIDDTYFSDIIVAGYGNLNYQVLFNNVSGSYDTSTSTLVSGAITEITNLNLKDLNADNDNDLVVSHEGGVIIYSNDGTGNLINTNIIGTDRNHCKIADIDGKGALDLVLNYFFKDSIAIFLNTTIPRVINVPQDFLTIQEAIDISTDSDTILVADGTYNGDGNWDINFNGNNIVLKSENGPDYTIIDCTDTLDHRGIIIENGEDSTAIVDGFSITGIHSLTNKGCIFIQLSSPKILNCNFIDNINEDLGSGISIKDASSTIINCSFIDIPSSYGRFSNAILCDSSKLRLLNCNFSGYECFALRIDNGSFVNIDSCVIEESDYRSAIWIANSSLIMKSSSLINNCRDASGGVIQSKDSDMDINYCYFEKQFSAGGGVLELHNSILKMNNSTFYDNEGNSGTVLLENTEFYIDSCTFYDNHSCYYKKNIIPLLEYWYTIGIAIDSSSGTINSCLFYNNYDYFPTRQNCVGISLNMSSPTISNCTFVGNTGDGENGDVVIYCDNNSNPEINNCIISFNENASAILCDDSLSVPIISCTDIYANEKGDWVGYIANQLNTSGNFSLDPLFCDITNNNYSIDSLSPCSPFSPLNICDTLIGRYGPDCKIYVDTDEDSIPDIIDSCTDTDNDGYGNPGFLTNTCPTDNCPSAYNSGQEDNDSDGLGDVCDNCPLVENTDQADSDDDGVGDVCDNCLLLVNPFQEDIDNDGIGDSCDNCITVANSGQDDTDADSIGNACDNCPTLYNPLQEDNDEDGLGNLCDNCDNDNNPLQEDTDTDGIGDSCDNCIYIANFVQEDIDGDNRGDICDNCLTIKNYYQEDSDDDGRGDSCDNCLNVPNYSQVDSDGDGHGDLCDICPGFDDDINSDTDTIPDGCDNCPYIDNPLQEDSDLDNIGDACDGDTDGDNITNDTDNCPYVYNPGQEDMEDDGRGDACDNCPTISNYSQADSDNDSVGNVCDVCPGYDDKADFDTDNIPDSCDNCPEIANPGQEDSNNDGIGDACCCLGYAGNTDCSEVEQPDISDITRLIDYLYISHASLCCPDEADADASGGEPDISDITRLIDHLYLTHQSLPVCP